MIGSSDSLALTGASQGGFCGGMGWKGPSENDMRCTPDQALELRTEGFRLTSFITPFSDASRAASTFWSTVPQQELDAVFAGLQPGERVDVTAKFLRREQRWSADDAADCDGFCPGPTYRIFELIKPEVDISRPILAMSEGFAEVVTDAAEEGGDPEIKIESRTNTVFSTRIAASDRAVIVLAAPDDAKLDSDDGLAREAANLLVNFGRKLNVDIS